MRIDISFTDVLGVWSTLLLQFWYLWLLILLPTFLQLIIGIRRRMRLARAGMREVDEMSGAQFEQFLELLFRRLGYQVERTRLSGDYGADLVIVRDNVRTVVQAKRSSKNVGVRAVQEVVAAKAVYHASKAMVITNQGFTRQAEKLAADNDVTLWRRTALADAILRSKKAVRTVTDSAPQQQ